MSEVPMIPADDNWEEWFEIPINELERREAELAATSGVPEPADNPTH